MIKLHKNYLALMILVVMFVLPGVLAYFFYCHPTWLGGVETNRGTLLKPPVLFSKFKQNEKWRIAYYSPSICDTTCLGNLDKLARVRLALGRHLYNVDVYLLMDAKTQDLTEKQTKILEELGVNMLKFTPNDSQDKKVFDNVPVFYLVSPENYIILSYTANTQPDDIFQDIKKLVKD